MCLVKWMTYYLNKRQSKKKQKEINAIIKIEFGMGTRILVMWKYLRCYVTENWEEFCVNENCKLKRLSGSWAISKHFGNALICISFADIMWRRMLFNTQRKRYYQKNKKKQ